MINRLNRITRLQLVGIGTLLCLLNPLAVAANTPEAVVTSFYEAEIKKAATNQDDKPIDTQPIKDIMQPVMRQVLQSSDALSFAKDWLGLPISNETIEAAKAKERTNPSSPDATGAINDIKQKAQVFMGKMIQPEGTLQSFRLVNTVSDQNNRVVIVQTQRLINDQIIQRYELQTVIQNAKGQWVIAPESKVVSR